MRRYHYLLTITVATLLGYLGGPLLARYLLGIVSPTLSYALHARDISNVWAVLNLQVWTPASRVLLIGFFLMIGQQAHRRFESAAETVLTHTYAFYRVRDRVCTIGTVFDYLIWAYTYATVRAFAGLATFLGVLIIPPFSLTQDWLIRGLLLIPFLFFAIYVTTHVIRALDHIYGEIPKKLGQNIRMFGYMLDYLLAREEETASRRRK
jgi:hypothetical protein